MCFWIIWNFRIISEFSTGLPLIWGNYRIIFVKSVDFIARVCYTDSTIN
nr:MAG TPA: hypothetical protein [Caudoviricetes sp.]